jgi:hypothetical protein
MKKKKRAVGSQTKYIQAVMNGNYANMIEDDVLGRSKGLIVGLIGGVILGALLKQNSLVTGAIGGVIGYFVTNKSQ